MKLLIVRHGDPDYTIDSLAEKGWKEVEFLSEKLSKLDIKDFYGYIKQNGLFFDISFNFCDKKTSRWHASGHFRYVH